MPLITWIVSVSALEFYFMHFIIPQLRAGDFSALNKNDETLKSKDTRPIEQRVFKYKDKKYVWIDSKWYYYNTDHVYVINSVPTLFIHNKKPYPEPKQADAGNPVFDYDALRALNTMIAQNPLQVYTPEGFKTLVNGVHAAQTGAAAQKTALEKTLEE